MDPEVPPRKVAGSAAARQYASTPDKLFTPNHLNPDFVRWERHRVWVVEATLAEGKRHIYSKRTFYLDEDSWVAVASDAYDGRGQLWRFSEQHSENWYNIPTVFPTVEVHNDLQSGRYIAMGLRNEERTIYEPLKRTHNPTHPSADAEGYVTQSNVNPVEEMVNMISASRSYQNNVEVMNTAKTLLLKTLQMGQ